MYRQAFTSSMGGGTRKARRGRGHRATALVIYFWSLKASDMGKGQGRGEIHRLRI